MIDPGLIALIGSLFGVGLGWFFRGFYEGWREHEDWVKKKERRNEDG